MAKILAKTNLESEEVETENPNSVPIFQGIGIIVAKVLQEEGLYSVLLNSKQYPLLPKKRRTIEALNKEIEGTNNSTQRLIVYPKVIHFPSRDKPYQILFQLVGFDCGRDKDAVSEELKDGEFKLSGLWQFIPVCRTPCISIFRNFSSERLEYIKQLEPAKRVKFLKASHLPLLWRDAPVAPFRFNPKAEREEQGHPAFVQIKAKFLPQRDAFGFVEELVPHQENAPKFLKVSKKDKAESLAAKK